MSTTTTQYEIHVIQCLERLASSPKGIWIHVASQAQLSAQLSRLAARVESGLKLPLLGLTVGVKDNIDVAGMPTTAACPAYSYTPRKSATVVDRLMDAGAIVLGKTNMDQFATGLVGTRSPFGPCPNAFDPAYISGGSSSGSAISVALGMVDFALGTDTAGSGRVPAAFNNLIGLKPTRGLLSCHGVVPACKSLDCVSIFTRTVDLARRVLKVAAGFDASDIYSRRASEIPKPQVTRADGRFRFGIPAEDQLAFFGNDEMHRLYRDAIELARNIGGEAVTIDYAPFHDAAKLLYEGPWVAERLVATRGLFASNPEAMLPVIRQIIGGGTRHFAIEAFEAMYRLLDLKRRAETQFQKMDVLLLPTAGTIYPIEDVEREPVRLNQNLGYYTNFVNLLDLAAIAIPAGFMSTGLPGGVTLMGPAGADSWLIELAEIFLGDNFEGGVR